MNRRRGRRDEKGAVALLVALVTVALVIPIASMAVDLGMQRVARRDMQAIADMVALDMSRQLDGEHTYAWLRTRASWKDAVRRSVARNVGITETEAVNGPSRLTLDIDSDGDVVALFEELRVEVRAGSLNKSTGDFIVGNNSDVADAVHVLASTDVQFAFASGRGGASRGAIAAGVGGACFKIGSYAAALDSGSSPILDPLLDALGSGVVLTLADYQALAAADVELLDLLAADVGAVTLEEALSGSVKLSDFYLALASALARQDGKAAEVAVLESIAASVSSLSVTIPMADLLDLGTGGAAGLAATLNVLDIATAAAAAATGANGATLPHTGLNVGPLAGVNAAVDIIAPPKVACGRVQDLPQARSSAADIALTATGLDIDLGATLKTGVDLSGTVRAASANGLLTDIRCTPDGITVRVSDGLLDVNLTLDVSVRSLAGVPLAKGKIVLTGQSTSLGDAVVNITQTSDYDNPVRVTNSSSGLPVIHADTSKVELLGLNLGWALSGITDPLLAHLVNPLVAALDDQLLVPLLRELGMDLSGADVFAVPTPKCDNPRLAG